MLAAVPGRRRRLSDGVLVEGSIRARLLGIRLLTIDATVVLAPAEITPAEITPAEIITPPAPAHHPAPHMPARSARPGLAEAVRSISEGAELLAQARRNGA